MITLLSDFGLHDASVAIAKGILMQHTDQPIIDISHDIQPYRADQAAYLLSSAYRNFPVGTCHIVLLDVFSDDALQLVLSAYEGQYFLSADNGIVPAALDGTASSWQCAVLPRHHSFNDWLREAGRMADTLRTKNPDGLGLPAYQPKTLQRSHLPVREADSVRCEILHIDHYENVVINISREQIETLGGGRRFRLEFSGGEVIAELSQHYTDVRDGYKLCRFNSSGYLEICVNRGRAASLFGLRPGSKFNDIKIFFE